MPRSVHKRIIVSENHLVSIKNPYGYDLKVINGTIKNKKGYFIKVDKKTFGPFERIDRKYVSGDDDRYFVCMASAIEAVVTRVGINGFEIVDIIDLSNKARTTLEKFDMAKGVMGVDKIGKNGDYAIYRTHDGKIFAEKLGYPLKNLSEYKMYDSYIEMYLYNLVENNDNSFFDVGLNFNKYSPEIFRKVWSSSRQRGDAGLDIDGIHRKNATLGEARRTLQIINMLKSKYNMKQLFDFNDCTIKSLNSAIILDTKKIDEINIDDFIKTDYNGIMWFCKTNLNKELRKAKLAGDNNELVISIDGKLLIFKDDSFEDVSDKYMLLSDAFEQLVARGEARCDKKQKELEENCEKLMNEFTHEEWDFLDFDSLRYNNSYILYNEVPKKVYEDYAQNYSVDELNEKIKSPARDKKLDFKTWVELLNAKKDFVNSVKKFINKLKCMYPDETKFILAQRRSVFDSLQRCNPSFDEVANCYFAHKSVEELNNLLEESRIKSDKGSSNSVNVDGGDTTSIN